MAAVVFTVDWESQSGVPPIPNEEIAEARGREPGRADPVRERRPGAARTRSSAPGG